MLGACNAYVNEVNNRRKNDRTTYVLSGTSGKAHHAWVIPGVELESVVVDFVSDALAEAISGLAEKTWASEDTWWWFGQQHGIDYCN